MAAGEPSSPKPKYRIVYNRRSGKYELHMRRFYGWKKIATGTMNNEEANVVELEKIHRETERRKTKPRFRLIKEIH